MDSRWQAFLEDAGAVFADGVVASFGNPQREIRIATAGPLLADLSHLGTIVVTGDDARTFLQGQLTNDIAQIESGHCQWSGYCNPQGRLLALFRVFFHEGGYHLELPRSLLEPTLERLRKYVLLSKVTLEDGGDCLARVGYSGPDSEAELAAAVGSVPGAVNEVVHAGELTVARIAGPLPRFVIQGRPQAMEKLWSVLDVHAAPVGAPVWEYLDILAGLPMICPETAGMFVPQHVNLDLVDGVSFQKGCYVGQEVVARLHYRGKSKRRMHRLHVDSDEVPAPGTPLYGRSAGQAAGNLVRAAPSPEGGCEALAVIVAEHLGHALHVGAPRGPRAMVVHSPEEAGSSS